MNHIMTMFDEFDNLFANVNAAINYDWHNSISALSNVGLKRIIKRPHNLVTVNDENGKLVGYKLEVVYTPFSKDDVSVEVLKNVLTITCGSKNKQKNANEDYLYSGVSYQTFSFSLPLDESIDIEKIFAKADDGMLRITMPLKAVAEVEEAPLTISVQ